MPQFDKTGPEGKGPRTGRGMGECSPEEGNAPAQDAQAQPGQAPTFRGGRGPGNGRGRRARGFFGFFGGRGRNS
jgi:hypothetical protein